MDRRATPVVIKWTVTAAGEAFLVGSVLSAREWYTVRAFVTFAAMGTFPFITYLIWIKSARWSILTGMALTGVMVSADLGFALVPDSSRDAIEGLWFLLGASLGCLVVAVGWLLELLLGDSPIRRTARHDTKRRA